MADKKLSPDDKKKIVGSVINKFTTAEKVVSSKRSDWEVYLYNFLQQYADSDKEEYYNNTIFVPLTQETILTLRPLLSMRRTKFRIFPSSNVPDLIPNEEQINSLLSWLDSQFFIQNLFKKKKWLAFYTLLYGFSVLYMFYDAKKKTVKYKDFSEVTGEVVVKKKDYLVYDDPNCTVVDITSEFFPDPSGKDIDNCRYVIYRKFIEPADLKRLADSGWIEMDAYNEWADKYGSGGNMRTNTNEFSLQKLLKDNTSIGDKISQGNIVEYWEYWEDDKLIIILNRDILARNTDNPYWYKKKPFIVMYDEDIPFSLFGLGEGEILESLQDELNTVRRLRLDNSKRVVRQKYRVRRGANVDDSQLLDETRLIIELDDPATDIMPFEIDDIKKAGIVETQEIRIDSERVTGVTDPFKGVPLSSSSTATQVSIMQQNTMSRLHYKASNFDDGMLEWAKWSFELARQFYPPTKTVYYKSDNEYIPLQIDYEVFTKEYTFTVDDPSTDLISKQEKLMLADMLFARFVNNPLIDQKKLIKKVIDLIGGTPLLTLVKSDEQLAMEQRQAQIMAQQQQEEEMKQKLGESYVDKIVPSLIQNQAKETEKA